MDRAPIEVLVFDLGGVIVAHDNAVMHQRLASRCRPSFAPAGIAAVTGDGRWATGRPASELFAELKREAGYGGDWPTFVEDWCCHLVIDPSMLAFVERLAAWRRVMIFSNTNAEHWACAVRASAGRLGAFERVLSHEIGWVKPEPRAFELAAAAARARPESLLFFDDVAANVEGARLAGWNAELFEGEAALRERLAELGLLVEQPAPEKTPEPGNRIPGASTGRAINAPA